MCLVALSAMVKTHALTQSQISSNLDFSNCIETIDIINKRGMGPSVSARPLAGLHVSLFCLLFRAAIASDNSAVRTKYLNCASVRTKWRSY